MKLNPIDRLLLGVMTLSVAVLQSSCSTADSEAWNKIQNEGLIPYLVEGQSHSIPLIDEVPSESMLEGESFPDDSLLAAGHAFEQLYHPVGEITAQPVAGKPGFVYTPHTRQMLEVDVRGFEPGTKVHCPYTRELFLVPGSPRISVEPTRLAGSVGQAGFVDPVPPVELIDQPGPISEMNREPLANRVSPASQELPVVQPRSEPAPVSPLVATGHGEPASTVADERPSAEPEPITGIPKTDQLPSEEEALALMRKEGPYVPVARRVTGKPNYVFSPFAASHQVVDVEGHEPGTKVKCPYTGKVFAVPAK